MYAFLLTPLFDRIAVPAEFPGVTSSRLALAPVDLVPEGDRLCLRVAPPPPPGDLPEDRGGVLKAVLFRRSDWISLDLLGNAIVVDR